MHIVIAGCGITGLTAAISLRRSGHRVTIYERSSLNNEIGAAINVPPNVSRFLVPLGLDPVKARWVTSTGMSFKSHTTLQDGPFVDHSRCLSIFGSPLYYSHRVDLHESLKRLATDPEGPGIPVKIHLKSEVAKYDPDGPSLILGNGTIVTADLVIAADGVHSIAGEAILGMQNQPQPANHNNCCYRFLIPKAELEADPKTSFFVESPDFGYCRLFSNPEQQRRLVAYPCRDYEILNFVGICYNEGFSSKSEDWQATVDKSELLKTFEGYNPKLLDVLSKATDVKRWPLLYRPPIPTWHRGRLAVAGDAAHPMLPHHGQGGAQGIEDGLTIGLVMHGVTDPSQIEERLVLYEKVRRNRASSIQVLSNFGYDQEAPVELTEFLEGQPMPKTMPDMVKLAYGPDLVRRIVKTMTEVDPGWKLPEGFFPEKKEPNSTAMDATQGTKNGTVKETPDMKPRETPRASPSGAPDVHLNGKANGAPSGALNETDDRVPKGTSNGARTHNGLPDGIPNGAPQKASSGTLNGSTKEPLKGTPVMALNEKLAGFAIGEIKLTINGTHKS